MFDLILLLLVGIFMLLFGPRLIVWLGRLGLKISIKILRLNNFNEDEVNARFFHSRFNVILSWILRIIGIVVIIFGAFLLFHLIINP